MFKSTATEVTKKDCLISLKNDCTMKIAELELEIAMLKEVSPDFVVGDRPTSAVIGGIQGKTQVKASELIKVKEVQLEAQKNKVGTIEELLKLC